jgi:hypothetical protein
MCAPFTEPTRFSLSRETTIPSQGAFEAKHVLRPLLNYNAAFDLATPLVYEIALMIQSDTPSAAVDYQKLSGCRAKIMKRGDF